ncbi:MAG: O-antigen ligase family protein [Paraprevotella sp.]|nr:O-antigen ligase family protein [Paraprevotella sp.]
MGKIANRIVRICNLWNHNRFGYNHVPYDKLYYKNRESMKQIFSNLWKYIKAIWRSKYKWIVLLFFLWSYRVGYMPNSEDGFARALQIGCLVGMTFLFNKYKSGIFDFTLNKTNLPIKSIYILYIYAILSAIWSIMPMFSAYLAFQNIVLLCGLTWLYTRSQTFIGTERIFLYFTLMIILFDAVCRRIFIEYGAIFTHHLTNGSTSAMLTSYCAAELWGMQEKDSSRKNLLRGMLIIALVFLITSTSSGANASAVFGIAVAAFLSGKTFLYIILFSGAIFLLLFKEYIDSLMLMIMPGKNKEAIETATGRTDLWDIMLDLASQKPWFGWGYACIERAATITGEIESPDAHNNYLGFYGSLGYVGSAIAYISFFITLFNSWKRRLKPGYKGIIAAFCCALLNGYSYGFLTGKACNITVAFFSLIVLTYCYSRTNIYHESSTKR